MITTTAGDPVELPVAAARPVSGVLLAAFALWNGSALLLLARHRTALLPAGPPACSSTGSVRAQPQPALPGPIALMLALPTVAVVLGRRVVPLRDRRAGAGGGTAEERYLSAKFGAEYDAYRHRTRRWLNDDQLGHRASRA